MASYYRPPQAIASRYKSVPELAGFFLNDVRRTGRSLGSGAFGVVEEVAVGRTLYAAKKIHSALLDIHNEGVPKIIERFITECKLMSRLRHQNIVQFEGLCLFHDSIHPVLVMEKLDVNFETLLKEHKNIPFPLVLRILQDIARGLVYLHGQRPPIIHRDLTARNVLIYRTSMKAKIADLGNALMADPRELSNTLSQAPGTLPYMPPEALSCTPKYDSSLDIFSFGHLTLYAVIQEFPKEILSPTYTHPQTEKLLARNEVERREKYIRKLFHTLSKDHAVAKLILCCLNNKPERRPTATKALQQLVAIFEDDDPGYIEINLVELINKSHEQVPKEELPGAFAQLKVESEGALERRIEDFKNGVPGLLEIYRSTAVIGKKQSWRKQVFQIKNENLMYFKSSKMDRAYSDSILPLSKVVCVKSSNCPPGENKSDSLFYFEVHFSEQRGSPWSLGAYTQDDKICWMEAIEPGSSQMRNLSRANSPRGSPRQSIASVYDDIIVHKSDYVHTNPNEAYSYVYPPTGNIYEEPEVNPKKKLPPMSQQPRPLQELGSYYYGSPAATPLPPLPEPKKVTRSSTKMYESKPTIKVEEEEQIRRDSMDSYVSIDSTDIGTEKREDSPPPLQKSKSIPKKIDTLSEISLENVSNLNSNEVQLWVLLQMQKVVQKMEYSTQSSVKSPSHPPLPPNPPPLDEIEEIYDQAVDDDGRDFESSNVSKIPFQHRPRSVMVKKLYRQERAAIEGKRYQDSRPRSSTDASQLSGSAHSGRPPIKPKPDRLLIERVSRAIPAELRQKREVTQEEMICTLKARNKTLSSEMESHLVIGDGGSGHKYATGRRAIRPEWTRARTQAPQFLSTLDDLKHKALFVSRSELSPEWEEIGKGQFGKVFKGIYRRFGIQVAIKTSKQYESEQEKSSFQREMMMMSKLIHPNIVKLFGLVEEDPPLIVLEYLPHGDLKTFLTNRRQSVKKLFKYMLDIATGMHYISEMGLIHRDLAARNIMVSEGEICKVGDFGLLRELPKNVDIYIATTKVAFPIRWMAPECHLRKEFSTATDVWSFGVVMWEMYNPILLPYKGMDNNQVVATIMKGTRLDIPEEYPDMVVNIMKACWQEEPSERPSFLLMAMLLTNVVFGID